MVYINCAAQRMSGFCLFWGFVSLVTICTIALYSCNRFTCTFLHKENSKLNIVNMPAGNQFLYIEGKSL